jgi:SAM-dependent methyltransferase
MNTTVHTINQVLADLEAIKARQKATWESGDFGQVARYTMPSAREFMGRLRLQPGDHVLDVACGTGNLAVIAARAGCTTAGVDIASNLIAQARTRARREGLAIDYAEGDAEALPYPEASFDLVVSMYGVMFAPRPDVIASELLRVTRPGGRIALANWTPAGFIGKLFDVFKRHVAPPPGLPSPMLWGDERVVRDRLGAGSDYLRLTRRIARLRFPFNSAGTVEFFRQYYGPTQRAFASLLPEAQAALRADLEDLQSRYNVSARANETENLAEYLEVHARRKGPPQAEPRRPTTDVMSPDLALVGDLGC